VFIQLIFIAFVKFTQKHLLCKPEVATVSFGGKWCPVCITLFLVYFFVMRVAFGCKSCFLTFIVFEYKVESHTRLHENLDSHQHVKGYLNIPVKGT